LRALALRDAERFGMPGLAAVCQQGAAPEQVAESPPAATRIELVRAGELWTLSAFGEQIHVKDSRGMQMLAKLVEAAGRELHALELAGSSIAADSDAGPALDAKARARYRARLAELVETRDQADAWGDRGRAERASEEIEALTAELERAFGLGGRERKVGAASERARSNVQRRITHALDQIRAASPRIGDHPVASVKTGTYCSHGPEGARFHAPSNGRSHVDRRRSRSCKTTPLRTIPLEILQRSRRRAPRWPSSRRCTPSPPRPGQTASAPSRSTTGSAAARRSPLSSPI